MATNYTANFSYFEDIFTQSSTFGVDWLIPLVLAFIIMVAITRSPSKWRILFLPIITLERIMGLHMHYIAFIIGAIMFGTAVLSTEIIGNVIEGLRIFPRSKIGKVRKAGFGATKEGIEMFETRRAMRKRKFKNIIGKAGTIAGRSVPAPITNVFDKFRLDTAGFKRTPDIFIDKRTRRRSLFRR